MPGQISYSLYMSQAIAGMIADLRSLNAESHVADAAIAYGVGVVDGASAGKSVKTVSASGDTFRGIALHRHSQNAYPFTGSTAAYAANDVVTVGRRGLFWCIAGGACTADGAVYSVAGTGKMVDDSTSNCLVPSGKFRSSATADGDLVLVEINLPA